MTTRRTQLERDAADLRARAETERDQVVRDVLIRDAAQAEKSARELTTPTPVKGRYRTASGHAA